MARKYKEEFKQAMIDDYYSNPRPLRVIAEAHGISLYTFNDWLTAYQNKKHKPKESVTIKS